MHTRLTKLGQLSKMVVVPTVQEDRDELEQSIELTISFWMVNVTLEG